MFILIEIIVNWDRYTGAPPCALSTVSLFL